MIKQWINGIGTSPEKYLAHCVRIIPYETLIFLLSQGCQVRDALPVGIHRTVAARVCQQVVWLVLGGARGDALRLLSMMPCSHAAALRQR